VLGSTEEGVEASPASSATTASAREVMSMSIANPIAAVSRLLEELQLVLPSRGFFFQMTSLRVHPR
jgi:hypothetical protein